MFTKAANDAYNELQRATGASAADWVRIKQEIVAWGKAHRSSSRVFNFPGVSNFRGHGVRARSDADGDIVSITYGDNV